MAAGRTRTTRRKTKPTEQSVPARKKTKPESLPGWMRWLSIPNLALYLNTSETAASNLLHKGEIKSTRSGPGAGYVVDRLEVDRYMERRLSFAPPYARGTRPWVKKVQPWNHRKDRQQQAEAS